MTRVACVLAALLALSPAQGHSMVKTPADPLPTQLYGEARIIDGKTLELPSVSETVRLLGYEAPELPQIATTNGIEWPAGEVARSWLILNTLQQVVNCQPVVRDRQGLILAHCFVGERNLALAGIEEGIGYSFSYPGEPRVPLYMEAERAARGIGRGIWSAKLEPPWEFRARHVSALVNSQLENPSSDRSTIPPTMLSGERRSQPPLPFKAPRIEAGPSITAPSAVSTPQH